MNTVWVPAISPASNTLSRITMRALIWSTWVLQSCSMSEWFNDWVEP